MVAGRCFPFEVGDIQIDDQGRIRPREDQGPVRFGFAYRGLEYRAEVETAADPRVRLTAELGKLPYSMEIGEGRRLIRCILHESARAPHGRIDLSEVGDTLTRDVCTECDLTEVGPCRSLGDPLAQ